MSTSRTDIVDNEFSSGGVLSTPELRKKYITLYRKLTSNSNIEEEYENQLDRIIGNNENNDEDYPKKLKEKLSSYGKRGIVALLALMIIIAMQGAKSSN